MYSQRGRVPASSMHARAGGARAHTHGGQRVPQGQAVDPKAERLFRKYLTILPALLRYLAPHPRVMQLQGPKFDFAAGRSTSERRCICHSIFDIATNTSKLPASLQDPVLSSLMQLLIGFPAECNDFSAQVCGAHCSRMCRNPNVRFTYHIPKDLAITALNPLRHSLVHHLAALPVRGALLALHCTHVPAIHGLAPRLKQRPSSDLL